MASQIRPGERVLIVDDDPDTLEMLSDVLTMAGVDEVRGAASLDEAEQVLHGGFRPSAVILDLVLDGVGGEKLASDLKADPTRAAVPIIAVSGDPQRLRALGGEFWRGYLKPVEPDVLVNALNEAWSGRP